MGGPQELEQARSKLVALEQEHVAIKDAILGDVGMSPSTRETLLSHLDEEEDELRARIRELSGREAPPRLTVGSLRPTRSYPPGPSVGTLRRS